MATALVEQLTQSLRQQIGDGDLDLALEQLSNWLSAGAPALYDEATLLLSRYSCLGREERRGALMREEVRVEQSRIVAATLDLIKVAARRASAESSPVAAPPMSSEVQLPPDVNFETIIGVNNLKQIAWIDQGLRAARSVCRILTPKGLGTGFLIAPDLIMTNNHVIGGQDLAGQSYAEFNYQHDFAGGTSHTYRYRLDPVRFHTSARLDYTIVGVVGDPAMPPLADWGCATLNPHADPMPGEHVLIIQHPNGGPKQIALTANQVASIWEYRLHYTTDTMPGSSGSPVFNDLWQVIAIHHAGGTLQVNAQGLKRFINEGILMSAIRADATNLAFALD